MDERRIKGLMGLCVRAGQAVFGISDHSRKRYEDLCAYTETRMAILPAGLLADATGRPGAAMAVKEGSFSEQLISCLD